MSDSNKITSNILQSISIIANQAINNANFDKTVQATIVSCLDATIGEYKVKYQDGTWTAFSQNVNTTYADGTSVYILIPGGDMRNVKTIVGTTQQLGINYINVIEQKNKYQKIGSSVITKNKDYPALCSYDTEETVTIVLYDADGEAENNVIDIDTAAASTYFQEATHFLVSAIVRTALPTEQQYNGNYGIRYYIDVLDKSTETASSITRVYTLDANNMQGSIYQLTNDTVQDKVFAIEEGCFQRIKKIEIFAENFPNASIDKPDDIFISDLTLVAATAFTEEELNGVSLELIMKNGSIFSKDSDSKSTKTVEAQVRVAGRVIDNKIQKLEYYWFVQNTGINSRSLWYNKNGGQGWKCLNAYKVIKENQVYSFNPGTYQFTVGKSEILSKKVLYKCVVIYDGNAFQKQFYMYNHGANYEVRVISDSGTEFLANSGNPILKCSLTPNTSGVKYYWSCMNSDGSYNILADETQDYNTYISTKTSYNNLIESFKNGTALHNTKVTYKNENMTNEEKSIRLANEIKTLEKQYVHGNEVYHVDIKSIVNFRTFVCTVTDGNDNVIGTDSIKIVNANSSSNPYTLVLNNGAQVFNYSQDGVSPCERSNENPYVISALTFTVYSAQGQEIPLDAIRTSDIQWTVPTENTMLTGISITKGSLSYGIQSRYSINKTNNTIGLKIKYDNYIMTAQTNLTFTKQGELGTNGTGLIVKIAAYNGGSELTNEYPCGTTTNGTSFTFNFTQLRAQLWKDGVRIFNQSTSGTGENGKAVTIVWEILKNKYTSSVTDNSSFNINSSGILSSSNAANIKTLCDNLSSYVNMPANIVKLTLKYDGMVYYATLPIITVYSSNASFKATLVPNTGFRYAIYDSSGRAPAYDNHLPFTILLSTLVNNVREDISISTVTNYNPSYSFGYLGTIYENGNRISKHYLMNGSGTGTKNQKFVKPLDSYDGLSVTNAVYSRITIGDNKVFVHIPIHFMLNRYGNAAINDWDGNSVSIDANGNNTILAPQVGAGQKDTANRFTGVLMGKVKNSGSSTTENGLFGYYQGQRSIFLDAKTGKAEFGKNGAGQIIIDPSQNNKAIIKSGNYDTNKKTGMQIDLATPQIRFGSGNFVVNSSGHLTASGGGTIAGWNIGTDKLYKDKVGMSSNTSSYAFWAGHATASSAPFRVNYSGNIVATGGGTIGNWHLQKTGDGGALYSGSKNSWSSTAQGVYLGDSGIKLGSRFSVDKDGNVTGNYSVFTNIRARSGYIGNDASGFTISNTAIYNGKFGRDDGNAGIYLGTNGISLGKSNIFTVDSNGNLTAKSATITGTVTATNGKIANWTINGSILYGKDNKLGLYSEASTSGHSAFWAGSSNHAAAPFRVDGTGKLYATGAQISGNSVFEGKITAKTGSIANWIIDSNRIYSGNMEFGTSGIKLGSSFSVTAAGLLTASSGKIGGWNLRYDSSTGRYGLFTDDNNIGLFSYGSQTEYHQNKRTVSGGYLKVGNFYALSNGTIQGGMTNAYGAGPPDYSRWSITKEGVATFSNATIQGGYLAPTSIQTIINGSKTNQNLTGYFDNLVANNATVNNLSVNIANINSVVATKATIDDLNAVKAKLGTVEANYITANQVESLISSTVAGGFDVLAVGSSIVNRSTGARLLTVTDGATYFDGTDGDGWRTYISNATVAHANYAGGLIYGGVYYTAYQFVNMLDGRYQPKSS